MAKRWNILVPTGEYPHPSGVTQVIDDRAVTAMADSFDPVNGVHVDRDHYSDMTDEQREKVKEVLGDSGYDFPSSALAWVMEVRPTAKGLEGVISPTALENNDLVDGAYKFLSPVFLKADCEEVGPGRVRPMRLAKLAATNENNIPMPPLMLNKNKQEMLVGPSVSYHNRTTENQVDYKALLLSILGLPSDAEDSAIEEAMTGMKNAAEENAELKQEKERATATIEEMQNRLVTYEKDEMDRKVSSALAEFKDVIRNREVVEASLRNSFDSTVAALRALKPATLLNRTSGSEPDGGEDVRAKRDSYIEEVALKNRCTTRAQAWEIAQRTRPELFIN